MSSRKSITILSTIIIGLLVVTGATILFKRFTTTKKSEKILRINLFSKIKSLDPHQIQDYYSEKMTIQVYEGLLSYSHTSEKTELVPLLAKSLPELSEDCRTYTFTLKENVFFHDNKCFTETKGKGREVTAQDVKYSLERIFDPSLTCPYMNFLESIEGAEAFHETRKKDPQANCTIKGIQVLSKYKIRITLVNPDPTFLYTIAMPFAVTIPKEAPKYYKDKFGFNPVGTGPWIPAKKLSSRANKLMFKANPNYHRCFPEVKCPKYTHMQKYVGQKLPIADKLHTYITPEASAAWLQFKKNKVDVICNPPSEIYKNDLVLGTNGKKEVTEELKKLGKKAMPVIATRLRFLYFNLNIKHLQNVDARRALTLAIDLNEIIRVVNNNYAEQAHGFLIPRSQGYDPNYKAPYTTACDLKRAKELLAKAGYPNGEGFPPFTLYVYSNDVEDEKAAICIKNDLAKINVQVNIVKMPRQDVISKIREEGSTTWSGCLSGWGLDIPDMINFLQLFYGKNIGQSNFTAYNDETFNMLYDQAMSMKLGPERAKLYQKMNERLCDTVPGFPISIKEEYDFIDEKIKNRVCRSSFIFDQEQYMDVVEE